MSFRGGKSMLGQVPKQLVLPLVHSATDAGCCAFSSPLSRVVAVATCAGHWRLVMQPWLGFPLGQALLCYQGLPIPGSVPQGQERPCACTGQVCL